MAVTKAPDKSLDKPAASELDLQLKGYVLTTAEILYHLPDYHHILQTFMWQHYDQAPRFPELRRFLDFWEEEIEGPLHSVRIAHSKIIKPSECRFADVEFRLH